MCRETSKWFLLLGFAAGMALGGLVGKADEPSAPATAPAPAKGAAPTTQRSLTEAVQVLQVRKAQVALDNARTLMEQARQDRDENQTMFDKGWVTIEELNEAERRYKEAQVRYEQAKLDLEEKKLGFLSDATLVTLVEAKKHRDAEGEYMATVTIRNESDMSQARTAMATAPLRGEYEPNQAPTAAEGAAVLSDEELRALLKVSNIIVRLKGQVEIRTGLGTEGKQLSGEKVIVGYPFEQIVRELKYGEQAECTFNLRQREIENVTVHLEFLGKTKEYNVVLKTESEQDLPDITSAQYSQVGQLGSKILYRLFLERLAKTERSFAMVVLNLPEEIPFATLDREREAIITEVRFTEEEPKQEVYLELSIPERLDPDLVDRKIPFHFVATQLKGLKAIDELRRTHEGEAIPPEEVARLDASSVELAVTPRGVGKLEIVVPNLLKEIKQGDPAEVKFRILNAGTLELRRVSATLELPLEWEGEVVPKQIELIGGGEKSLLTARIRPPEDVDVGEYTVKIQAEGHSGVEIEEADPKDLTISVKSESHITGTVVLVGVLIILVLGIAIASIKISRR